MKYNVWAQGCTSIERLTSLLSKFINNAISGGTAFAFIEEFASKCDSTIEVIKEYLRSCKVKGADETGLRTDGSLYWLHIVCDKLATYLYSNKKRGFDAISDDGLLLDTSGVLIHDCWSPYFRIDSLMHALCLQHIQRELRGAMAREKEKGELFKRIEDLLLEMRKAKMDAIEAGCTCLDEDIIEDFRKRWSDLVDEGLNIFPSPERKSKSGPGRTPQGKTRSLLKRLKDYKDNIFLFLEDFDVGFTNNESERGLRGSKVRQSVSKCFRTEKGLGIYAKITSVLDTARKTGIDIADMITAVFDGTAPARLRAALL